jgi:hypothetical protein
LLKDFSCFFARLYNKVHSTGVIGDGSAPGPLQKMQRRLSEIVLLGVDEKNQKKLDRRKKKARVWKNWNEPISHNMLFCRGFRCTASRRTIASRRLLSLFLRH